METQVGIFSSLKSKFQRKSVPRAFQLHPHNRSYLGHQKPWYQDDAIETSKRLRESVWTAACIQAYTRCITSVNFIAQKWDDESGSFVRVANHPIERRIDKPNGYMPLGEFMQGVVTNLLKDGNALISIKDSRTKNETTKLEILHSDGVVPVLGEVELIQGYKVTVPGWPTGARDHVKFVRTKDMIHIRLFNSEDLAWGISPLEAAESVQDGETMAMAWNRDIMRNSGRPSFVLTTEDPLNERQRREIRNALIEDTARESSGLPLILMNGLKPISLGATPVDLDYTDSAYLDMERICSLLGVPPVVAMVNRGATLANVREFMRAFYTQSVIPLLKIICQAFTQYWIEPRYNKNGEEYRLYFDVSDISELRAEMQEKIGMVPVLFDKGYTMNELNRMLHLGLPEIPCGNIRQVSGHIVDDDGWDFVLPVAPGGAPNGSGIGQGDNETGGTVGLRPDVSGDPDDPTPKKPQVRKKPFGRKAKDSKSEKDIQEVWEALEADRRILSGIFKSRVAARVKEDFEASLELPGLSTLDAINFMAEWERKSREEWTRFLDRMWTDCTQVALKSFDSRRKNRTFGLEVKAVNEAEIAEIAISRANHIVSTSSHWILDYVNEQLSLGMSSDVIAASLRRKIPEITQFRAQVIVENEVLSSVNFGNYIGAVQSGTYTEKTWRTQRDNRVRPSHVSMEGQTTLLSTRYDNGLRFPCDPEGPASEIINCRCFETYA